MTTSKNNSVDLIQQFENQFNNLETLKSKMFQAIKVPLSPVGNSILSEGQTKPFEKPSDTYGIYKSTGGECLGVTKGVFQPVDLHLLMDVIFQSVSDCKIEGIDIDKIEFTEYLGGRKVSIDIPFKSFNVGTPKVGDIVETKLQFRTGFDGLTKMSLGYYTYRLWCANGAGNWNKDIALNYRNTEKNVKKMYLFCDEIVKATNDITAYFENIKGLMKRTLTKEQLNTRLSQLLGFDVTENDLHIKRANLVEGLLQAYDIEATNTGANEFSLLQGVTRFTTHEQAQGKIDNILYGTAAEYNNKIHQLLLVE